MIMSVYGGLYKILQLNNDLLIRIVFYFPAVSLSFVPPLFFARYLKVTSTCLASLSLFMTGLADIRIAVIGIVCVAFWVSIESVILHLKPKSFFSWGFPVKTDIPYVNSTCIFICKK